MKICNLKEQMIIKNYKELCALLDIKTATNGDYKKKQLEELSLYCNYVKQGNKFIIKEIYKNPTITLDDILKTKNSKYINILGNIIIEYLYNNPRTFEGVPINTLFTLLGITNTNYTDANYYRKELSQLYDIRLASIYYFYSNTKIEFKRIIERCLNNLKSRRVLNWYKVVMIKDENTQQIYKADKETEKFIIDTEKEVLQYLKCNNMYEVIKDKKKLKEFNSIIYKETNINYFYAYDLVIGERALKIEFDNIQNKKKTVNDLILNKTNTMFNKNKFKKYICDYNKLNELLINLSNSDDMLLNTLKAKRKENIKSYNNDAFELVEKYEKDKEILKNKYMDQYAI